MQDDTMLYEAVFYFNRRETISRVWSRAAMVSVFIVAAFLLSLWHVQQEENIVWVGVFCFFAGMLLNVPLEIARAVWRCRRCLDMVILNKSGLTVNHQRYPSSDIKKLEIDNYYLKIETKAGARRSYWIGDRYMPDLADRKFSFEMQEFIQYLGVN